jgi:hypothetical protein
MTDYFVVFDYVNNIDANFKIGCLATLFTVPPYHEYIVNLNTIILKFFNGGNRKPVRFEGINQRIL